MQPPTASSNFPEIKVPALLTFLALIVGFVIGNLFQGVAGFAPILAAAEEVGGLWLKLLQLTILPLVIGLVVTGISQTLAAAGGGRLARRAVLFFVVVLLFAGVIADILDAMVPSNIFSAAANNAMLPVVLFAAVFALALTRIAQGTRQLMVQFFEGLAAAMMVIVGWVLMLAPLGVFGLAVSLAAQTGADAIGGLAHYILIVSAAGLVVLLASVVIALTLGGRSLGAFARAMVPVFAVAISTQSSLASLPAMLAASRKLGVRGSTADFVLPLAVAIFRGTSPAMNMAVAIYVAYLTGTPLSAWTLAAGVLVAFLVSLSSVSLPGTLSFVVSVGPIAMAMGVPIEPLALLVAVEMLPDIMRTLGNVTADVAVTAAVDRKDDRTDTQQPSAG